MSSQYRGVCWHKHSRKWVSQIRRENTVKCLGYFDSEDDAGRAYDDAIREYYSGVQKPQGWRSYNLEEGEWGVALLGRRIRADRIDAVGCGFIVMGRVYGHHAAHRVEGALKPHFIRYDDGVVQWVNIIRSSHIKLLSVESVPYSFSSEEEAEDEEEKAEEAEAEAEEEEAEEEAEAEAEEDDEISIDINKSRDGEVVASSYIGVTWGKRQKKWRAEIYIAGKRHHLGYHHGEDDAARAYNAKYVEHGLENRRYDVFCVVADEEANEDSLCWSS